MLSIVYMSSARRPFSDEDLDLLLSTSRVSNTARDLTGLLVYLDGRFMQLLEGPDAAVVERYAKIAEDPRHGDLLLLNEEHVDERRFPEWSMAYDPSAGRDAASIPGFSAFLQGADQGSSVEGSGLRGTASASANRADALLRWFRTHPLAAPTLDPEPSEA